MIRASVFVCPLTRFDTAPAIITAPASLAKSLHVMVEDPDFDFVAMPKIELHAHLSGSISRDCLHEIWASKKAAGKTDLEDPLHVMPPGKRDYDLKTFFPLFSSYIYHLVNDVESVVYSTRSVMKDFAEDGVCYLELRTTPRALQKTALDKAGYIELVLATIWTAQTEFPSLHACLNLSIDRRNTLEEAHEVITLAKTFRDRGVVGVDICGDPSKGDLATLTPAILEAQAAELKVTVHFAEWHASDDELDTIMSWTPDRLGHVIHIPERIKRRIAAQRPEIGLELCLSCNVHAKMITGSFEAHHFGEWWRVEGPVVVPCTDDVGVFESPLSNEWRLIQQHFGLNRQEILSLARKGINVIFGGEEEKTRLHGIMW